MSVESSGTRDRFFDGRNAVRRAVLPQLIGRTLSINDPDGRAVARWDVADMALVDQNKANGSMVFTIGSDPKPRLVLFEGPRRAALLSAEPRLRRWRRHRTRHGFAVGLPWTLFGIALAALLMFGGNAAGDVAGIATAEKAANGNDGTPALTDQEWRAVQTMCTAP